MTCLCFLTQEFEDAQKRSIKIGAGEAKRLPPFQQLQFLVRDWQNFEDDDDVDKCLAEMPVALDTALKQNVDDDGTREAIKAAFERLSCFLLPHPGIAMTKKKYDGDLRVRTAECFFLRPT